MNGKRIKRRIAWNWNLKNIEIYQTFNQLPKVPQNLQALPCPEFQLSRATKREKVTPENGAKEESS